MDDDAVWGDLDDIERLLPPHTTEYRSGFVLTPLSSNPYEEATTLPNMPAVRAD